MMGYFPNATEGDAYAETWCYRCANWDDGNCAVMLAHLVYNYSEANNRTSILHLLIPQKPEGIGNDRCRMFRAVPHV